MKPWSCSGLRSACHPLALAVVFQAAWPLAAADPLPPGIESIEHLGPFIRECTLPGETRKDDVVPRHANAIQVSKRRWLVVYSTHGFRGVDDERSIIYQLRGEAPNGPLLKEGFLARADPDWNPEGVPPPPEGKTYFKQHGHMVAFGVPRGAVFDGKPLPQANVFAAKWRVLGRPLDRKRDYLEKTPLDSLLMKRTQAVEWVQFRLNDREDDIEILQPVRILRQKGFERGDAFTSAPVGWMNQSFCPPVPFNREASEWVDCNHFDGGRLAVLKYRFNPQTRLYEWVETGPLLGDANKPLMEASLVRLPGAWLVAARTSVGKVAWVRTANPFASWPEPLLGKEPAAAAPLTAFACPDGTVRLFTGDRAVSPQKYDRDPLYCWDVQVDKEVSVSLRQTLFDSEQTKLPIRRAVRAKIDFCELFPYHERTQLIVHGVSTRAYNHPYAGTNIPPVNAEEKAVSGIYCAKILYRNELPSLWHFNDK
jgi:hypothetical protein